MNTVRQLIAVVRAVCRRLSFAGEDQVEEEQDPVADELPRPARPTETYVQLGMSPEDYLVRLARARGGRLKQQQIVEATGWSEPTVSRLLSKMEDRGRIVRVQVGTEKVVGLPDAMPTSSTATGVPA